MAALPGYPKTTQRGGGLLDIFNTTDPASRQALAQGLLSFGGSLTSNPSAGIGGALPGAMEAFQKGQNNAAMTAANNAKTPEELMEALGKINDPSIQATLLKYRMDAAKPEYKTVGNTLGRFDAAKGSFEPIFSSNPTPPQGYRYDESGALAPIPGGPADGPRKLSATEQKELYDTVDTISNTESAIGDLTRARELLNGNAGAKPYTGAGAETRAEMNRLPVVGMMVDDERAAATTEYKNLVGSQALSNLKAIFGGMPTEGERQILMSLQALPEYTPEEQQRILDNAISAAEKRLANNRNKADAIETGDRRAMISQGGQPRQPSTSTAGGPAVGVVEDGYEFLGGDPSNPASWRKAQ